MFCQVVETTQQFNKRGEMTTKHVSEVSISNLENQKEILIKRKQLLTTILGYYKMFPNKDALAIFINTNDPEYVLSYLNDFKKKLRKKYVYKTAKNFIEYKENIDELLKLPLYDIDLDSINYNLETFQCDSDVESDDVRNMIFFNKIHVPAEIKENDSQKKLLLNKKILVKRDDIK